MRKRRWKPVSECIPLILSMECCATQEEMNANIDATIARGYTPFADYLSSMDGRVALCGAGPSLGESLDELKSMQCDLLACNSAIGFLLEHGIVPRFGMIWDAHPICAQFAIPHPEITYLIAARCHADVFERLKDCKVIVWYAGGDHNIHEFMMKKNMDVPLINGGSAAVTRGLYLARALGYTEFHVFGADSSYEEHTHVTGPSLVNERVLDVYLGEGEKRKQFRSTPEWCAQVQEFKLIYQRFMAIGWKIEVHGAGMMKEMFERLKLQLLEGAR